MNPMLDLADLFDKLADEMSREPVAAVQPAPEPKVAAQAPSKAAQLNSLVKSATGQELPAEVAARIASDNQLFESVTKLAEYGARPTPMGDAIDREGSVKHAAPMTKEARIQASFQRWNERLLNPEK